VVQEQQLELERHDQLEPQPFEPLEQRHVHERQHELLQAETSPSENEPPEAEVDVTALCNYEDFHSGTATLDQVARSSAGVSGWTRSDPRPEPEPEPEPEQKLSKKTLKRARAKDRAAAEKATVSKPQVTGEEGEVTEDMTGMAPGSAQPDQDCFDCVTDERIDTALALYGLRSEDCGADGDCQFRSLAFMLLDDSEQHEEVRAAIVDELRLHRSNYEDFHESWGGDTGLTYDDFVRDMAQVTKWGGYVTLSAASKVYGREITVVHDNSTRDTLSNDPNEDTNNCDASLERVHGSQ
jgi:hypothetical protein